MRVAAVAAGLSLTLALAGCGSSGSSSLFSSSPLDMFKSSPKVTTVDTTNAAASLIDTDYDCPEVRVRNGAATLLIGSGNSGDPGALDVRYQGSITRLARECRLSGNTMIMKVGIEGRVVTGPAGAAGTVDVPIRLAVVREGVDPKTITSKFARETVTLSGAIDRANFTHIDPDVSFPLPAPITDISSYVVYVGFDPQSEPEKKKPPARKPKARPGTQPKSS